MLTFNSARTLRACLEPLPGLSDDIVCVDSGSQDETLAIVTEFGMTPRFHPYETHARQMNHAISLARYDWVLCLDSDEMLDAETVAGLRGLSLSDPDTAYRISRHWIVLGQAVRCLYPVSSPDYPVRLFHRATCQFNQSPVDDKPEGFARTEIIQGHVRHDTFPDLHELLRKLNDYTTRLVRHKKIQPSLWAAFLHAPVAFFKWYVYKGGFRDGKVGVVAGVYAGLYTFLKYFKAWYWRDGGK